MKVGARYGKSKYKREGKVKSRIFDKTVLLVNSVKRSVERFLLEMLMGQRNL